MKDRHIRLDLRQESHNPAVRQERLNPTLHQDGHTMAAGAALMRCVGWDWASRCMDLHIESGTLVNVAYKIRNNDHPEYGGIEIELAGIRKSTAQ